jgi:choline-sulfatase
MLSSTNPDPSQHVLRWTSFLFCLAALTTGEAHGAPAANGMRPNILFILTDDQTFDAVHALGNDEIQTPNLDRLVEAGTTLTHAYNMGSWVGAVCIASRTMLVTGRSLWRAQRLPKDLAAEQQQGRLWPQLLKHAGYGTYFAGKWHSGGTPRELFDAVGHVRAGMAPQTPEGYNRPIEGRPDPWSPSDPKFGGKWTGGRHWSATLGDDAEKLIALAATRPEPFFVYLAFNSPHDPRQSPQEALDRYPADRLAVPRSFLPEYPYGDAIGAGRESRDERLAPYPRTEFAVRVHRREYYAAITYLDEQVGRIMAALDRSGRAADTYVFFTSDHGLSVGEHGLFGKQDMFDDSLRVPFVVVGPGIAAGRRIDTAIYLQDVLPTTLELARAPVPDYVEFHSLLPLLRGGEVQPAYPAIYGGFRDLQRAVSADGYKLILYPAVPKALLFDLVHDPLEMDDRSSRPESLPRMRRLFAQLEGLQRQIDDPLDLAKTFPELAEK